MTPLACRRWPRPPQRTGPLADLLDASSKLERAERIAGAQLGETELDQSDGVKLGAGSLTV